MMRTTISRPVQRLFRDESGQMVALWAVGVMFLFAILAISVETGFMYMERRNLQNAADAAALAGAQQLPNDTAGATTAAVSRAQANESGLTGPNLPQVSFSNSAVANDTIKVVVHKTAATIFGGWFSLTPADIQAQAVAQVRSVSPSGIGASPLTITDADYQAALQSPPGTLVCLKSSQNDSCPAGVPSQYQVINIGAGGSKAVKEFLAGGSTEGFGSPISTQGTNGDRNAIRDGLYTRLDAAGLFPQVKTSLSDGNPPGVTRTPYCLSASDALQSFKVIDYCNPLIGAAMGTDPTYPNTQPTAVILIPIVSGSFKPGSQQLPIAQDPSGLYEFAFFFIDPSTYLGGKNATCPSQGNGQCAIVGYFVGAHNVATVTSSSEGSDFDSGNLVKVVRLIQ